MSEKGRVSDVTYNAFLNEGFTPAHVPEIMIAISSSIYTNYFNNFNQTDIDFPSAPKI